MFNLSIPGYIIKALTKYQHAIPPRPQHQPYKSTYIQYGAKVQQVIEPYASTPLTKDQIKHFQDIVGTLLYYEQAVIPTIVTALIEISSCQVKGTEAFFKTFHQLLDYLATHTDTDIQYHYSNIILVLDTDASYLSEHGGKSEPLHTCSSPRKTN